MTIRQITGSEALAYGALDAARGGRHPVQYVTGYPGSPSTATVEALLRLAGDQVRIEWAINEKSAFDVAFGASLAGVRSLLCLKSVGLNVALDSLMVSNLAPGDGGFVILVGDDPGGWGSQNEEDSRPLVASAEIPLLEPTSVVEALAVMSHAFDLSERFHVPVAVRVTRALTLDRGEIELQPPGAAANGAIGTPPATGHFRRQGDRFNVLPIHVVEFHRQLQSTVNEIEKLFEDSPHNGQEDSGASGGSAPEGEPTPVDEPTPVGEPTPIGGPTPEGGPTPVGVITAGHAYQKLAQVLAASHHPPVSVLRLSTLYPLPTQTIVDWLRQVGAVLVLEETAPYVETQVQAMAQRAGLNLPIHGRSNGRIPAAGEILAPEIVQALAVLLPGWRWPSFESGRRTMPSRQPLCDDCPYRRTLEALLAVMERHGGRNQFVITGETGCMVRAQLPPLEILDVKYGMGSSIGLAAGLARTGIPQRVIALSGDSALLHSGLGELIDAAQASIDLLVVVLANETTALSGGQPHPATSHDAQGRPRPGVDLAALVRAAGATHVQVVDPEDVATTQAVLEQGLTRGGLAVVIAQRACPVWIKNSDA
jgi:indolepyruvate ferredoxin oxidoreductase alpha subunit